MRAWMVIDQYGNTEHLGFTEHPRKALLEKLGVSSARKQYTDLVDGTARHTGYVVGGRWFTLFEVIPFRGPV